MLDFLFNPNGRVSRWGLWVGLVLPQFAVRLLAAVFDAATAMNDPTMAAALLVDGFAPAPGVASILAGLFFLWPNIAVPVKRFHDRGMSGWWVLWFMLLVAAGCAVAVFGLFSLSPDMQAAYEAARRGVQPAVEASSGGMLFVGLGLLGAVGAALTQAVILCLLPGHSGSNAFGPNPRDGSAGAGAASCAGWADRLDLERLNAAAPAAPAPPRALRTTAGTRSAETGFAGPRSAGPRPTFGRRGA